MVATDSGGIAPVDDTDLPNQATVGRAKGKSAAASKKILKIACYADDPREPELIGEAELDYGPTLKKGEFDGESPSCKLVEPSPNRGNIQNGSSSSSVENTLERYSSR